MLDFIRDPSIYNLVRGPFVWIAFLVFIGMSVYKVRRLYLMAKNEKVVLPSIKMRSCPEVHSSLDNAFWEQELENEMAGNHYNVCFPYRSVFTPIFLLSHNVLWYESWGISWWSLPEKVADIMTLLVIVTSIIFF